MVKETRGVIERKEIRLPDLYIRADGTNKDHLDVLRAAVISALGDGIKIKDKPTAENWPLDPIIVWKNPTKKGKEYEIIEGVHRYILADEFKLASIPVIIRQYENLADARLAQLTENQKSKLAVDFESRAAWVKMLCSTEAAGGLGMKQDAVAKAAGLSVPSISRILSGTQTGEGRRKKSKKNKKKKFTVEGWLKTAMRLATDFDDAKNSDAIIKALGDEGQEAAEAFGVFAGILDRHAESLDNDDDSDKEN